MSLSSKLTVAQLFRLGVLCEEHDEVMRDRTPITEENLPDVTSRHLAVQAPIVRLLHDAGVRCDDFGKQGYDDYHPAFMLSTIAMSPESYTAGSGGHEILIAAGVRSTDPSTWPVDNGEEDFGGDSLRDE